MGYLHPKLKFSNYSDTCRYSQNFANRFLSCICKLYMFYLEIQMFKINDLYGGHIRKPRVLSPLRSLRGTKWT